jgi:hypothetical protein
MTEQEQQLIAGLAERIRNAPAPQIDRDADDLIRRTIGSRTDALYILTQTVLIQEMALNQTKAQMEDLKQQLASQQAPQQGGFLRQPQPGGWGEESRVQQPSGGYQNSSYYQQPPPPPPPPSGGGFSGFLHNAATTAAGVIAGEIAFDSLASLFGHRGGGIFGGGGGFFGGGGGISPGSETIVNNYYGDEGRGDGESRFANAADQSQGLSPDLDDERDNSGSDASGDDSGDSFASDDSSFDDGGGDDGGSSDV